MTVRSDILRRVMAQAAPKAAPKVASQQLKLSGPVRSVTQGDIPEAVKKQAAAAKGRPTSGHGLPVKGGN